MMNLSAERLHRIMFSLPSDGQDRLCPECRRVMVDLSRYAAAVDNDATGLDGENHPMGNMFTSTGRDIILIEMIMGAINFVFGGIIAANRRRKVKKMAQDILPQFPKSQICPACLFVLKLKNT